MYSFADKISGNSQIVPDSYVGRPKKKSNIGMLSKGSLILKEEMDLFKERIIFWLNSGYDLRTIQWHSKTTLTQGLMIDVFEEVGKYIDSNEEECVGKKLFGIEKRQFIENVLKMNNRKVLGKLALKDF